MCPWFNAGPATSSIPCVVPQTFIPSALSPRGLSQHGGPEGRGPAWAQEPEVVCLTQVQISETRRLAHSDAALVRPDSPGQVHNICFAEGATRQTLCPQVFRPLAHHQALSPPHLPLAFSLSTFSMLPFRWRKTWKLWNLVSHPHRCICKHQDCPPPPLRGGQCWWVMLMASSPQEQLRQGPRRLLREGWYVALPLNEDPELLPNYWPW